MTQVETASSESKPIQSTVPQVGEEKLETRDLDTVVKECKQLRREVGSLRAENTQLRVRNVQDYI